MKRMAWLLGGVSLFGGGMFAVLAACGGDDDATIADADAGNTSSSGGSSGSTTSSGGSSGTTSSSGGSSGSPGDGGNTDGGTDGGSSGFTSNPNKVSCGAMECTNATQICCRSFFDAGCVGSNDNCPGGSKVVECDEKADCANGDVCCQNPTDNSAKCDNNCKGSAFMTCKTNAECAGFDGGTCKEWTCPGGTKFRSCAMPFFGCQ